MYKNATVRSLDYFNRRKVLCVYIDITVLFDKKLTKLFQANIYRLKVKIVTFSQDVKRVYGFLKYH